MARVGIRNFTVVFLATTALTAPFCAGVALAQTLPTGASVAAGSVAISRPSATNLTVTQSSQSAVVNYQSFSVGQGNSVNFVQPNASSAILNRVTSSAPSTIAGQVNANGQVYLVNPNGIAITRSGTVNAGGGFVASTLGINDSDFMAGKRTFTGTGSSAGVSNAGTISVGRGGYAALIGGTVSNSGSIDVPLGKVGLGSGERATLDFAGDGFLQVAVPTATTSKRALIRNSGSIKADGGSVILSAATAREAARNAINISGTVQARAISGRSGSIVIGGAGGRVRIAGRLIATSRYATGGRIVVTGQAIKLKGATIDASGKIGGGNINIGGGRQGTGALQRADTVSIDGKTTIKADAITSGNGGTVVVWSDLLTTFAGTISARGGTLSGNGGEAEVSGKAKLAYTGLTDLRATNGRFGTLLLDPYNVTISNDPDSNQTGLTATGNDSVINAGTLITALGTASVTVSTGASGTQAGNITLAANTPLSWTTSSTLQLQARGNITLNSAVTAGAGGLFLAGGSGTVTATDAISVARFILAGNWIQNSANLPAFSAGNFQIIGGSFLRAAGGDGRTATPYLLTDIYGVQGMGTSAAYLAANYKLANDIDASGTATWNSGAGFIPVGNNPASFTGSLNGASHTITGLTINRSGQDNVGLFSSIGSSGGVTNLGLVGGSFAGSNNVGSVAGQNAGTVSQVYATGNVSGSYNVGGLVGLNVGAITQAYATGTVSGDVNSGQMGGLVGDNIPGGVISQAYATGAVSGGYAVGGVVGSNFGGTVTQTYASGAVSTVPGSISPSGGPGSAYQGGIAGYQFGGTVTASYWDIGTTGQSNGGTIGGSTRLTTAQARSASSYSGWDFTNVWYQAGDLRPILRSEAAAAVNGVIPVSNLHQLQLLNANLSGSYVLTRDLDASATNATAASTGIFGAGGFSPIGGSTTTFAGSLNGASHTISGLTINLPNQNNVGLIGYLSSTGSVNNLGLVGGSVSGKTNVGGLVGQSGGTIGRSYVTGSVSGLGDVGGLIGYNTGTVKQAYATGSVTGLIMGGIVGGLLGYNNGNVSETYATGKVSGQYPVAGFVGINDVSGTITASYFDKDTTGQSNGISIVYGSYVPLTGLVGLTTAQARSQAGYVNAIDPTQNFDFTNVWYQAGDMRPILRSEAAAAVNGVIPVSNLHQLQLIGANLSGSFALTRNIDASATNSTANSAGIFGAGGFVPVGNITTQFTGNLNGAGHTVSGLTINHPSQDYVGLIGVLGTGGNVTSVGIVDSNVAGASNVGSLAGYSNGSISQSFVSNGSVSGYLAAGGLVGNNDNGTVIQSSANVDVLAVAQSGQPYFTGGLIGYNSGAVRQSYATGSVRGNIYVGGLIGENDGLVNQSYAAASVSSIASGGGLIGYNNFGQLSSNYWDTDVAGQTGVGRSSASGPSAGVTGLTTLQMTDLANFRTNFAGFDFANVWAPPNQIGQSGQTAAYYPQLYALSHVLAVTPTTSRAYGEANPSLIATYSGLRTGDFVTTPGTLSTSATMATGVGTYGATASGTSVTAADGASYRILYVPGALTITPRALTVTAANQSKVYGQTLNLGTTGFTTSGLVTANGDAVTGVTLASLGAAGTANVGSTAITASAAQGSGLSNYTIGYANGTLTVTPASLTVTATNQSKVYGQTLNLGTTGFTTSGLVTANGDAVTGVTLASLGAAGTANVGSTAITASAAQGSGLSNYTIGYANGTLTVTPASLTVTAANQSKVYGQTLNLGTTGFTTSGLVTANGDAVTGVTLASLGAAGSATVAGGPYAITASAASGSGLSNYTITYAPGGLLTVTPAQIVVTARGGSSIYGTSPVNPGLSASGLQNGEQAATVLTGLGNSFGIGATTNAGGYATSVVGTLTNANYTVSSTVAGSWTVTQRPITVTANPGQSRVYGDADPVFGYTVSLNAPGVGPALVNNDRLAGALTSTATAATGVGSTSLIKQGSLTTAANPNYLITYQGANLTITQRQLIVVADAQSRVYGDANPALTYKSYTLDGGGNVTIGLVNNDTLTGGLTTNATAMTGVGSTSLIAKGTLAASANYNFSYYVPNILTITPRALAVVADAQGRVYGDANPALTYKAYTFSGNGAVTYGLVNGDQLTGNLATTATTASNVGNYGIAQGTLAASANYTFYYATNILTITPRALAVVADAQGRVYGDTNPALTYKAYTFSGNGAVTYGLVNGDQLTGNLATTATTASNVGNYGIAQGTLAASANYNFSYYGGNTLTVSARPITVFANAQSRGFLMSNPALTYSVGGRGLVNGDQLTGGLATNAGTFSLPGSYAITQGSLAASPNYALSYVGANLNVTVLPPSPPCFIFCVGSQPGFRLF